MTREERPEWLRRLESGVRNIHDAFFLLASSVEELAIKALLLVATMYGVYVILSTLIRSHGR
jgi:hypothetical protein